MAMESTEGDILSDHNKKNLLILETIRRNKSISRTDISKITKLNIVTVSNYVADFIDKGLVVEKGLDVSSGGRRPTIVQLNAVYCYAVGVDLGLKNIQVVLTDLEANIVAKKEAERPQVSAEAVIKILIRLIEEVLEESSIDVKKIRGICVAASGVIDREAGTVHSTDGTTSVYLPINIMLERKFDVPTLIENDATSAAYGEWALGISADVKVALYMYSGVGCGIIINGEVFRGATGIAGEISLREAFAPKDFWVGNLSILGPWALDLGMPDAIRSEVGKGRVTKISEYRQGDLSKISLEDIFRAAKEDDELALEALEKAGEALGGRIAYLINILNPEVIVVGGGIEEAGSILFDSIKQMVRKWSFDEAADVVKVVPARFGKDAVGLGAACLMIRRIFSKG